MILPFRLLLSFQLRHWLIAQILNTTSWIKVINQKPKPCQTKIKANKRQQDQDYLGILPGQFTRLAVWLIDLTLD